MPGLSRWKSPSHHSPLTSSPKFALKRFEEIEGHSSQALALNGEKAVLNSACETRGWTMNEQDIVIYHHPNPEMKSFLLSEEISAPRVEHIKNPLTPETRASLKPLGVLGAQIAEEIMAISGVAALQIKPKEIRVKKEVSASWEDIQGKVLDILRRALRRKQIRIVRP
jgi:hypothetical protein